MTKKKMMTHAKSMPNLYNGTETLHHIIEVGDQQIPVTFPNTFQLESIARVKASEVETAARVVGVYLSIDDLKIQEKYERILAMEELHLYDILYSKTEKAV